MLREPPSAAPSRRPPDKERCAAGLRRGNATPAALPPLPRRSPRRAGRLPPPPPPGAGRGQRRSGRAAEPGRGALATGCCPAGEGFAAPQPALRGGSPAPPRAAPPGPALRRTPRGRVRARTEPGGGGGARLKVTPAASPVPRPPPHLAPADDVGVLRQQVHHLPLALVAPLGPQHDGHLVAGDAGDALAVGDGGGRGAMLRHGSRCPFPLRSRHMRQRAAAPLPPPPPLRGRAGGQ